MKKIVVLLILIALVSGVYAGGTTEAKKLGKQTVVFWNGYTGPDRPVLEDLVAQYNANSADIEIKMEIMPWDTLFQKLMPAMIAGNAPDLIAMSVGRYAEYAEAGKLASLDEFIQNYKVLDIKYLGKILSNTHPPKKRVTGYGGRGR